ncbi:hypothetical protein [Streptomyces sp. AcE210]|uniref:hypothetical protein n=1 Tax=Streptomyces sp. AcE210 TaxID=2292703 RepID=UPI001F0C13C4|nr:hypothetical protein [Streptomyces sp. AcE210]
MTALIYTKSGQWPQLIPCIHLDRGPAKGRRKSVTETDYARLLDAHTSSAAAGSSWSGTT